MCTQLEPLAVILENCLDQESVNFFWKGQRVNILGFAGQMVSVAYSFFFNPLEM